MPTYSYACTACEHRFDTKQSFTDPSLTDCPECSGRLRKLFSPVGVVFKGSGFYRTDSRAGPPSDAASGDKSKTAKDSTGDSKSGSGSSSSDSSSSDSASGSGSGKSSGTATASAGAASSSGKSGSASTSGS